MAGSETRKRVMVSLLPLVVIFAAQWAREANHPVGEPSHPSHHRHQVEVFHSPRECEGDHTIHCCLLSLNGVLCRTPGFTPAETIKPAALLLRTSHLSGSFELYSLRGPPSR